MIAAPVAPPPAALSVSPPRLVVRAGSAAVVRVANPGMAAVTVSVTRAGYALDRTGRPRVDARNVPARGSLFVSSTSFRLRPHSLYRLGVRAGRLAGARAGDHATLLLLSASSRRRAAVALSLRIGVVVVLRAPGPVVRRLALGRVTLGRGPAPCLLRVAVANRGNLDEWIDGSRLSVGFGRPGRPRRRAVVVGRRLLARSGGLVTARCGGEARGLLRVVLRLHQPARRADLVRVVILRRRS